MNMQNVDWTGNIVAGAVDFVAGSFHVDKSIDFLSKVASIFDFVASVYRALDWLGGPPLGGRITRYSPTVCPSVSCLSLENGKPYNVST